MRKKKRGLLPYALAAVISGFVFVSVSGFLFVDLFFKREDKKILDVPSFVGESADNIASDEIQFEQSYIFSDSVEKGRVISQSHKGKIKVANGEKYVLSITVSLGRRVNALPDLAGLDIYEASGIIREMGCIPKTVFCESDKTPDSVLFTLPKAKSELCAGDTVTIYVATRATPKTVRVPDFYGCSLQNLQSRVEDAGLSLGKIEFIYSEDFLPGVVVYQGTRKNCLVKQGEKVDFYISKLPES